MDIFHFKLDNITIESYDSFCRRGRVSKEDLTLDGFFDLGSVGQDPRDGKYYILYEEDQYHYRKRFTLVHELGHIRLGHRVHCPEADIEAHYFASQTMCPDCLLRLYEKRGCRITWQYITSYFGMSREAAEVKLNKYRSIEPAVDTELENRLMLQLLGFTRRYNPSRNANVEWAVEAAASEME